MSRAALLLVAACTPIGALCSCAAELQDPEGRFGRIESQTQAGEGKTTFTLLAVDGSARAEAVADSGARRPSDAPGLQRDAASPAGSVPPSDVAHPERDGSVRERIQDAGLPPHEPRPQGLVHDASVPGSTPTTPGAVTCPAPIPASCEDAPPAILTEHCAGRACHGTPEHKPLSEVDLVFEQDDLVTRLLRTWGTESCAERPLFDVLAPTESLLIAKLKYPARAAVPCGDGMPPQGFDRHFKEADAACLTAWLQAEAKCL